VPVTLLALGPALNIGEALTRAPEIAGKVDHVYAMAGAINTPYPWEQAVTPEWNVLNDVEGFRQMLAAPWALTLSPVDGCGDIVLRGDRYARVSSSQDPCARVLIENFERWHQYANVPEGQSSILYDTPAVCMAFDESYFGFETLPLSVDDRGLTYIDPDHGRPTRCQMGWAKRDAFEDLLASSIAGPESGTVAR
jgi:inosine-uridine nucleoside N-ribohydrolase